MMAAALLQLVLGADIDVAEDVVLEREGEIAQLEAVRLHVGIGEVPQRQRRYVAAPQRQRRLDAEADRQPLDVLLGIEAGGLDHGLAVERARGADRQHADLLALEVLGVLDRPVGHHRERGAVVLHGIVDRAHLGVVAAGEQHRGRRRHRGIALAGGEELHRLGRAVGRLQRDLDALVLEETEMLGQEVRPRLRRRRGFLAEHQRQRLGRTGRTGERAGGKCGQRETGQRRGQRPRRRAPVGGIILRLVHDLGFSSGARRVYVTTSRL